VTRWLGCEGDVVRCDLGGVLLLCVHVSSVFPEPEHRSSALSQQASILYVALCFVPGILHESKPMMREVLNEVHCGHVVF
jgi:hypothetical protein